METFAWTAGFWNGAEGGCAAGQAVGTIVIRSPKALGRLLSDVETGFGESYLRGEVEVRGELAGVLPAVYRALRGPPGNWLGRAFSGLLSVAQANSLTGSRRNIHQHYDFNADFLGSG